MRFRLELELTGSSGKTLPINYQYELSSWIYNRTARTAATGLLHRVRREEQHGVRLRGGERLIYDCYCYVI